LKLKSQKTYSCSGSGGFFLEKEMNSPFPKVDAKEEWCLLSYRTKVSFI